MHIYVTGDCHGDFSRFAPERFPEWDSLTKDDTVLVCGDFGGVWDGKEGDRERLDALEKLPFTLLFVDGNHENYDELATYPVTEWNGGKVRYIRPHVLHLLRGQIFNLNGRSFFTMGGARSLDVWDGILDPEDPDFAVRYWELHRRGAVFRVKHLNWWEQELPSPEEYGEARRNLERAGYHVNFIVTHCGPSGFLDRVHGGHIRPDALTDFLEEVRQRTEFDYWFFGHYHENRVFDKKLLLLYRRILRLP